MLSRLATIFMVPRVLLHHLPGKMFKEASVGFSEMTVYLHELRDNAEKNLEQVQRKRNRSLLGKQHDVADPEELFPSMVLTA